MSSLRRPFRLNVGFIIHQEVGSTYEFPFKVERALLGVDLELRALTGTITVSRTPQGLLMMGDFAAETTADCARCLRQFNQPLTWTFTELYAFTEKSVSDSGLLVPEDAQIDLQPLMRDYALLEIPITPICRRGCRGLCPVCGQDLNTHDCGHRPDASSSEFAALKDFLKQKPPMQGAAQRGVLPGTAMDHTQEMPPNRQFILKIAGAALAAAVLAVAFYLRAIYNLTHIDFGNTNFVFFWLAGRMSLMGENPYNTIQWLAAHDAYGVAWRPNAIFPYPLPLAYFMAPLGLLSLAAAYFTWQILSQVIIALTVWSLLRRWSDSRFTRLLIPLTFSLLFFGPVYLTLQIGALGAFTLVVLLAAMSAMEHQRSLLAGLLLSLTILKPSQAAPILALAGIWLLSRRDWKAIQGGLLGSLALVILGLLRDPLWISKFGGASQVVLDRTLGIQSNTFGFAYLACQRNLVCMWIVGGAASVLALGLGGFYLWRNRGWLTPWEAFNIIIPVSFVTSVYLWSYDQAPYVIPIVWIAASLVKRTKIYAWAFIFLILLVAVSFGAVIVQANTRQDFTSILTTALVLGLSLLLSRAERDLPAALRAGAISHASLGSRRPPDLGGKS